MPQLTEANRAVTYRNPPPQERVANIELQVKANSALAEELRSLVEQLISVTSHVCRVVASGSCPETCNGAAGDPCMSPLAARLAAEANILSECCEGLRRVISTLDI